MPVRKVEAKELLGGRPLVMSANPATARGSPNCGRSARVDKLISRTDRLNPSMETPVRHYRGSPGENCMMVADCASAYVVDGDTLRCGRQRIRLLGIDAPEIERCPRWRVCAPGDGQASKRSLRAALNSGPARYQRVTTDRYGRTVAVVWAGRLNLSCWQLQQGQAIYKARWDNGGVIARACR